LVLQNHFLINRTPFLDFPFMVELFKTELAGCNAEFKVSDPFDRFKGQALYPYIIKKTFPALLKYKLDKEYTPGDFLTKFGHLKIAFGYFKRKFFIDQDRYKQPSYSELTFSKNMDKISKINTDYPFIHKERIRTLFNNEKWSEDYVNFNIHVSFLDYLDYTLNHFNNVEME
ncbi:MAG: hypothetical protein ACP5DQ_13235, partial [Bacteroidales bacterium]